MHTCSHKHTHMLTHTHTHQMEGQLWVRNILLTCFIFCGPFFTMFSLLNTVAITYRVSNLLQHHPPLLARLICWRFCVRYSLMLRLLVCLSSSSLAVVSVHKYVVLYYAHTYPTSNRGPVRSPQPFGTIIIILCPFLVLTHVNCVQCMPCAQSTAALPFGTIVIIIVIWGLVTIPLTVFGGIAGKNNRCSAVIF